MGGTPERILSRAWLLLLLGAGFQDVRAQFSVMDLGPGVAYDINSAGKVAAYINGQPVVTDGANAQTVLWSGLVAPLPGAINDAGDVLLTGPTPTGVQIVNGTNVVIIFSDSGSQGGDLNNNRVACGYHDSAPLVPGQIFAFRYNSGALDVINYFSHANGINSQGTVVGMAATNFFLSSPQFGHRIWYPAVACIISNPAPVFLDSRQPAATARDLDGATDLSEALAMNDNGVVVGWYRPVAPGPQRAFRYLGAGLEDLGTLGGTNSVATRINLSGMIVGWSQTASGEQHAYMHTNNTMVDLNSLLPSGSGWILQAANSVNDSGLIVGYGLYQGVQHGFLLSPPGLGVAPVIVSQPVGGQAAEGGSFTFTVAVNGTQPLGFQWQKDKADLEGATGSSLVLTHLNAFDSAGYRVVVTNSVGTAISDESGLVVQDPLLAIHAFAGLTVSGEAGGTYRIDYATNASSSSWTPLVSLTLTNTSQLYIDLETPLNAQRVYRAVRVP